MWCYYAGHKDKTNTKSTKIENQIPDASDSDTKLSSTNSKVTSNKTRIVHTVKKAKWAQNFRQKTKTWSDKRSWSNINKGADKEIDKWI